MTGGGIRMRFIFYTPKNPCLKNQPPQKSLFLYFCTSISKKSLVLGQITDRLITLSDHGLWYPLCTHHLKRTTNFPLKSFQSKSFKLNIAPDNNTPNYPVLFCQRKKKFGVYHRPQNIPSSQNFRPKNILRISPSCQSSSGAPWAARNKLLLLLPS